MVALQRVGVEAVVFEKAPEFAEVGAGLSLWSNPMLALRRLGLEVTALQAGSVIERIPTFLSTGESLGSVDFAALGEKAGLLPSACTAPPCSIYSWMQRWPQTRAQYKPVENARVSKRMQAALRFFSPMARESGEMY